jgi:type I restriction enzyme M protein
MLDNETRRRIDTARDILVGKVPDPKSQVEQITIALIYKFMDDMDKEAIEFGGTASFFTGDYEKYGWSKIFDPRLGGYEMLSLYGEAIEKLDQNPNIPQLFRDIFKNAYLPYRDPETLKLFLKTINEFHYDHSEKLGDAFEYLLSVLGSQGDAGQFRTPRHIIDFIVEILQPKKNETILDPACGTAGFLISSYKYMLKENTGKAKGDLLTPSDRKNVMNNFTGYDISPDMVRLSLVNMYLHHFTSPKIYEYDTLTSEDRWGDYFDIIMANPPFMTPKGGIKPHKKFTMQANRSEVLFVDYIAEHINPTTGRAGVIVPEGIIFQSATAYKALRKLLVDKNYLYAVVSLPAGIFNPYSGVKTSILLMDKTLAKKTDKILFVKIENDGFDLGAQRKPIDKNDLPAALDVIKNYQLKIRNDEAVEEVSGNYLLVEKEKIKANGEYNLSMDRYFEKRLSLSQFDLIRLGDIVNFENGKAHEQFIDNTGKFKVINSKFISSDAKEFKRSNEALIPLKKDDVVMVMSDVPNGKALAKCFYVDKNHTYTLNQRIGLFRPKSIERLSQKFLYLILNRNYQLLAYDNGQSQTNLRRDEILDIQIPLPPLYIQQEIVNKIEGWQKIIDGAKQIIENYKPQIDIDPGWEMVKLGDDSVFKIESGGTPNTSVENFWGGNINWITLVDLPANDFITEILTSERKITSEGLQNSSAVIIPLNSIVVSTRATIGRIGINKIELATNQGFKNIIIKDKARADAKFIAIAMSTKKEEMERLASGGTFKEISKSNFMSLEIPCPSISIQKQIVDQIEQEQQLINANKQLIQIFEQKIKDEINKLWQADAKEDATDDEVVSLVAEQ